MTAVPVILPGTGVRVRSVQPVAVDTVFVFVLVTLGLIGFRSVYGGTAYLVVGVAGALLGLAITEMARQWSQTVLVEAFVTLLVFLLLGGVMAAPHSSVAGILPTPHTIFALGHVGIYGWKELLTTTPPVGNSSDLLAIPYVIGLIGAVVARSIAIRTRSAPAPLVGPVAVLALGILFGARYPASLLLQGSVFGCVALGWVVIRYQRSRPLIADSGHQRTRLVLSVVILAVSALAAGVVGPRLPGANSHSRVILSRYVVPPFDANDQSSPLAGFRKYTKGSPTDLYDTVLFSVSGLGHFPREVRISTMDEYDGVVWGFGAGLTGLEASESGDVFRRFGPSIPAEQSGPSGTVTVRIGALGGVWMPEIGETTSVSFSGTDANSLTSGFLYDTATATAADAAGLQAGDTYRLDVVVPPSPSVAELSSATSGGEPVATSDVPSVLQADANQWVGSASGAWGKVMAIATHLKTSGAYSDGTENPPLSLPGHNAGRLESFLEGGPLVGREIVGDDEQYAATLALMANAVGVPARVVLGAAVEPDGVVKGKDVQAWVEVSLAGLGWVPVYQKDFLPKRPAVKAPPSAKAGSIASAPVEPPEVSAQRPPVNNALATSPAASTAAFAHKRRAGGFRIPGAVVTAVSWAGPPLIVILAVIGTIFGLKSRRRRRRRFASAASSRFAGGWSEFVDFARDIGHAVPGGRTRREQASTLGTLGAAALAGRADAAVFGPGDPSPDQVDDYWTSVDQACTELRSGAGRWVRWRATVSLRSFRFAQGNR